LSPNAAALKALIEAPGLSVMPGCYDAIGARLIADAGYRLGFVSGSSVAGARLARPDIDVLTFLEMADAVDICSTAAPEVLWLGDGDTGYGNEINVQRTVRALAKAGASAVLIEDKAYPRPLGHQGGKVVVDRVAAIRRCRAAVEACRDAGVLLLARTDAISSLGRDEALARIACFVEAGADMLYLDSPPTFADIKDSVRAAGGKPAVTVHFQMAKYALPTHAELEAAGVKLVLHPVDLFAAGTQAMRAALTALTDGTALPSFGTDADRARAIRRAEFLSDDARWSGLAQGPPGKT
jgi:2-methylisocitrate lyase-like PEP mutase family enzyme